MPLSEMATSSSRMAAERPRSSLGLDPDAVVRAVDETDRFERSAPVGFRPAAALRHGTESQSHPHGSHVDRRGAAADRRLHLRARVAARVARFRRAEPHRIELLASSRSCHAPPAEFEAAYSRNGVIGRGGTQRPRPPVGRSLGPLLIGRRRPTIHLHRPCPQPYLDRSRGYLEAHPGRIAARTAGAGSGSTIATGPRPRPPA